MGTYETMAPEMLTAIVDGKALDSNKIDLWGLGCIFY